MSEGDELNIISFIVSIPVDVIIRSGDVSETFNAIVNESSVTD